MTRLVPDIKGADPGAAGLLIECRGQTPESLKVQFAALHHFLQNVNAYPSRFARHASCALATCSQKHCM
jgi:hypothetical protein